MPEGMSFSQLLTDPNFLQMMGQVGQKFSSGASVGEALNPADMIRQIQNQKAVASQLGNVNTAGGPEGGAGSGIDWMKLLTPTPIGQAGPDSVNMTRTADGTTMKIVSPSEKNLSTFGKNVSPESVQATPVAPPTQAPSSTQTGGVPGVSPFFRALFK